MFCVGDSAGQCFPLSGEGIRTAFYFGIACGRELRARARRRRRPRPRRWRATRPSTTRTRPRSAARCASSGSLPALPPRAADRRAARPAAPAARRPRLRLVPRPGPSRVRGLTVPAPEPPDTLAAALTRLRDAEARWRHLVEHAPVVTYVAAFDAIGTLTYVSPQVEALLGHPPAAFLAGQDPERGGLWERLIHPDDRPRVLAATAAGLRRRVDLRVRVPHARRGRPHGPRPRARRRRPRRGRPARLQPGRRARRHGAARGRGGPARRGGRPSARRGAGRPPGPPRRADRACPTARCWPSTSSSRWRGRSATATAGGAARTSTSTTSSSSTTRSATRPATSCCARPARACDAHRREADVLARPGGDEFLLLRRRRRRRPRASWRGRPRTGCSPRSRRPSSSTGTEFEVGGSIGVSVSPARRPGRRHAAAPRRRRDVRGQGRGPRRRPDLVARRGRRRAGAPSASRSPRGLRRAVERDELVLHWQPVVRPLDGRVHGCEALVRWEHPERGLAGPGRVHPAGRGDRPDRARRRLGRRGRLPRRRRPGAPRASSCRPP